VVSLSVTMDRDGRISVVRDQDSAIVLVKGDVQSDAAPLGLLLQEMGINQHQNVNVQLPNGRTWLIPARGFLEQAMQHTAKHGKKAASELLREAVGV
jgi:hypothetical protein